MKIYHHSCPRCGFRKSTLKAWDISTGRILLYVCPRCGVVMEPDAIDEPRMARAS